MSINKYLSPADNGTTLRDYRHAARIFTDDNFRLSPKYGFLFYVEFDFNPLITNVTNLAAQELGMIVKSASLPKFTIDTKVHNAYNRVNIVQNKIKYDPVQIVFHDDQSDNVRNFWYDYYSFFFRDPDYATSTYGSPHKYASRPSFDWGYSPRPTVGYNNANGQQPYQYIQGIRIYSLYQKNFSEYQLINPVITSFKHGEHANGESTMMSHEMNIQFETVKYLTGYTTPNTVGGYIDLHYDSTPSPIAPSNGTDLVDNGQGGYSRASETITDLANQTPLFSKDSAVQLTGIRPYGPQSFASTFGAGTTLAASAGINQGGFSIPALGSLAQGITSAAITGQQLQASAVNLASGVVNSAATGLIGGLAAGLGPNGGATINLLASAIQNPQALVATATNMAATYAMQEVGTYVTNLTQPLINTASGWIKDQASDLLRETATSFGDISLFGPQALGDLGGAGFLGDTFSGVGDFFGDLFSSGPTLL
jgi:hypothetical protein